MDWDARYKRFRPVFEAFDARGNNNPVDSAEYHQAWINATKGLLDRHMAIYLYNPHLKKIFFEDIGSNSVRVTGLSSGDIVVTAGVHKLHEGQKIKLMEDE